MFCPNCGREIPDGTVCPCAYTEPPLSTNPTLHVIKSLGSSGLFLGMAICSTVAVVFTLLANAITSNAVPELLNTLLEKFSGSLPGYYDYSVVTTTSSASVGSLLLSAAVSGVYAVAFWLHYFTCRSRTTGNITTHGLTIWQVFAWISVIGSVLAAVAVAVVAALFTSLGIAFSESPEPVDIILVVAILVIIIGVYLGFLIAYHIMKLRLISRVKSAANTGLWSGKASGFLVVLTYIAAIFTGIGALGSAFVSPLSAVATMADAVQIFLMAMLLSRFKKAMTPSFVQSGSAPFEQ